MQPGASPLQVPFPGALTPGTRASSSSRLVCARCWFPDPWDVLLAWLYFCSVPILLQKTVAGVQPFSAGKFPPVQNSLHQLHGRHRGAGAAFASAENARFANTRFSRLLVRRHGAGKKLLPRAGGHAQSGAEVRVGRRLIPARARSPPSSCLLPGMSFVVAEVMATGFGFCWWDLALCMGVAS